MKNSKILIIIGIVIALAVILTLSLKTQNQSSGKLQVFAVLPLSGAAAAPGNDAMKAMQTFAAVNPDIEIVFIDSESNPAKAITAVNQKLATVQKPIVISAVTSISAALVPLVSSKGGFTFCLATLDTPVFEKLKDFQRLSHGTTDALAAVADHIKSHYKNIVIISSNEEYGIGGAKAMEAMLQNKVKIAEIISYNPADLNVRETVAKAAGIKNIDAIFVIGVMSPAYLNIFRTMSQQKLQDRIDIVADISFSIPGVHNQLKEYADGIIFPCLDSDLSAPETEPGKSFRQQCLNNQYPAYYVPAQATDILNLIKYLYDNKIPINQKNISDIKVWKGVGCDIVLQPAGGCLYQFIMAEIKNNSLTRVR